MTDPACHATWDEIVRNAQSARKERAEDITEEQFWEHACITICHDGNGRGARFLSFGGVQDECTWGPATRKLTSTVIHSNCEEEHTTHLGGHDKN